jgi:amidase
MVSNPCLHSAVEHGWQRVARRKKADREIALAKFAEWRTTARPQGTFDVSKLPLQKLTERERLIVRCDATALADLIRKRLYTSVEVLIAYAKAAVVAQDVTNCLTEIFIEEALHRAQELDTYIEHSGNVVGALHGQLNFVYASASVSCSSHGTFRRASFDQGPY